MRLLHRSTSGWERWKQITARQTHNQEHSRLRTVVQVSETSYERGGGKDRANTITRGRVRASRHERLESKASGQASVG